MEINGDANGEKEKRCLMLLERPHTDRKKNLLTFQCSSHYTASAVPFSCCVGFPGNGGNVSSVWVASFNKSQNVPTAARKVRASIAAKCLHVTI
jgi:hypothetical protein